MTEPIPKKPTLSVPVKAYQRAAQPARAVPSGAAPAPSLAAARVATKTRAPIPFGQTNTAAQGDDGKIRLNKRMAELGMASRREADDWISKG